MHYYSGNNFLQGSIPFGNFANQSGLADIESLEKLEQLFLSELDFNITFSFMLRIRSEHVFETFFTQMEMHWKEAFQ